MNSTVLRHRSILTGILIFAIQIFPEAQTQLPAEEIGRIQRILPMNEVILEYTLTDSTVRINAIDHTSTLCANQSLDRLFWRSMKSFQKLMKSAETREFSIYGELLYQFLIKPVQVILSGKQRLIIIPDERLSGLPFEAFIRSDVPETDNNFCNLYYLIQDYEVVYQSSVERWNEQAMKTDCLYPLIHDTSQYAFMGFSPVSEKNGHLASLPGSGSEITDIGSLFCQKGLSSWLVFGGHSEKEYFKSMAGKGKIVHVATHYIHSERDYSEGGFVFSDYNSANSKSPKQQGLLTLEEINVLKLEADLIVLNACGSGVGRLNRGTASQSLPDLLINAGARNILSTLWNVTDNLAGDFMRDFYRSVLSGKTYSEALREVKLQWISCRETTLPTIWAPYVLTGE
jgi:CHAT domain-containing protein